MREYYFMFCNEDIYDQWQDMIMNMALLINDDNYNKL